MGTQLHRPHEIKLELTQPQIVAILDNIKPAMRDQVRELDAFGASTPLSSEREQQLHASLRALYLLEYQLLLQWLQLRERDA